MLPGFVMWLLGVPLGIILLLWLFGVLSWYFYPLHSRQTPPLVMSLRA